MGQGAGLVKPLPQRVVGLPALVGGLPLVTQAAQRFLHLAAPQALPLGSGQQGLGLADQLLAQLVRAPALPVLQLTRLRQHRVRLALQFGPQETPG